MTWFANQIYSKPVPDIIDAFRKQPFFRNRIYHVTDLTGIRSDWTREIMLSEQPPAARADMKHGLPDGGLLVVCPNISYELSYEQNDPPSAKWQVSSVASTADVLFPEMDMDVGNNFWPKHLLRFLKGIQTATAIPIVYYYCATWGGPREIEAAWIFDEVDSVLFFVDSSHIRRITAQEDVIMKGDVLQLCMEHLSLHLPTHFFALHETTFEWDAYRIEPEASHQLSTDKHT